MLNIGLERPWQAQTHVHTTVWFDSTGERKRRGGKASGGQEPVYVITEPGLEFKGFISK